MPEPHITLKTLLPSRDWSIISLLWQSLVKRDAKKPSMAYTRTLINKSLGIGNKHLRTRHHKSVNLRCPLCGEVLFQNTPSSHEPKGKYIWESNVIHVPTQLKGLLGAANRGHWAYSKHSCQFSPLFSQAPLLRTIYVQAGGKGHPLCVDTNDIISWGQSSEVCLRQVTWHTGSPSCLTSQLW